MFKNASILHIFYEISLGSEQLQVIVSILTLSAKIVNKKKKVTNYFYFLLENPVSIWYY
jgi:hypothetical protein